MSKLLSALVAAGFAFSLTTALAQNVKSDSDKAKGQEDVMQKKEQGTSPSKCTTCELGRTYQTNSSAEPKDWLLSFSAV